MGLTVLDAGILIAVLDGHDAHHVASSIALRRAHVRGDRFVLPVSAYAESLVAPYRRGRDAVVGLDAFVDALPAGVEPITREIASRAAELRAKQPGVRLPDALVIATAVVLNADRLLTTDAKWPRVGLRVEVV